LFDFVPTVVFILLAIGWTWWYIYTYKECGKLKVQLEIMKEATGVDYVLLVE
jgi:hypothetical protein